MIRIFFAFLIVLLAYMANANANMSRTGYYKADLTQTREQIQKSFEEFRKNEKIVTDSKPSFNYDTGIEYSYLVLQTKWLPAFCNSVNNANACQSIIDDQKTQTSQVEGELEGYDRIIEEQKELTKNISPLSMLWLMPQTVSNTVPEVCKTTLGVDSYKFYNDLKKIMLPQVSGDAGWKNYGSCISTSPDGYFEKIFELYALLILPDITKQLETISSEIELKALEEKIISVITKSVGVNSLMPIKNSFVICCDRKEDVGEELQLFSGIDFYFNKENKLENVPASKRDYPNVCSKDKKIIVKQGIYLSQTSARYLAFQKEVNKKLVDCNNENVCINKVINKYKEKYGIT